MSAKTKLRTLAVTATTALFALAAGYAVAGGTGEIATPNSLLKFNHINPAIEFASADGNFQKGAHGTFGKFPANFITPFHTHTGAYKAVVIKGTMTNPFKGEQNPPKLEPGSYWAVPAGSVHATACVSKEPCMFYFYADSGFNFTPVD